MDNLKSSELVKSFDITIDEEEAKKQYKIIIDGIEIYFPYPPYQPQIEYMKNIIQTLYKGGNISALESPTGTGKTLCLLCSVLGWSYQTKNKNIKNIYYCTKTVSQIKNVLKELQKTCYKVKNSFLVSRKFACLSIEESSRIKFDSSILSELCRNAIHNKIKDKNMLKCEYYSNDISFNYKKYDNLADIEDLFKEGKKEIFCPYFYNIKKTKNYANLTFMSYHYILNPFIRNKLGIIDNNAIIIIDEAHNICSIFERLFTKKLDESTFKELKKSLQIILDNIDEPFLAKKEIDYVNNEINKLKIFINKLGKVKEMMLKEDNIINDNKKEDIFLCSLEEFKNIFFKEFNKLIYEKIDDIINKLVEKSKLEKKEIESIQTIKKYNKKMLSFLTVLNEITEENIQSYKFTLSKEEKNGITFCIHCVDASYGMKDFLKIKPYSVILTSGTLSINMLENLLQVKFYRTLENDHVINNNQFLMNIIEGDKEMNFRFFYNNRKNENQILSLGKEINNLAKSVKKGGILVFLQSYDFLKNCHDIWLRSKVFGEIEIIKSIIFDIKQKSQNIEKKIEKAKKEKNLLLFTVYRGKNSEGINFEDDDARMVICIGIPYPNLSDLNVKLKRDFIDERFENNISEYDSNRWYKEEAYNAVNQALGRLIRHKNDYGIMICFGIEFKKNSLFSKWIKPNEQIIRLKENDNAFYKRLQDFLSNMQNSFKTYDIINIENSENKLFDVEESSEYEESRDNYKESEEEYCEDDKLNSEEELEGKEEQFIKNEKDIDDNFEEDYSYIDIIGHKRKRFTE